MRTTIYSPDIVFVLALLMFSIIELHNSFLIVFFHRERIFLTVRMMRFLYMAIPISKEKKKETLARYVVIYKKRMKLYGIFGLVGCSLNIFAFVMDIISRIL